jgi:hypothetical protein
MKTVNIRQLKTNPSTSLAVSLFRSTAVSAGNDTAAADEACAEMRRACGWLAKPAA